MKRVVIGLVVVALGLLVGAPMVESRAWDPEHPPVWIPVTAEADRPSGDDGGWVGIEKTCERQYVWWQFEFWVWKWVHSPLVPIVVEPSMLEPTVVTEGTDEEPSAPTRSY